jgi:hypothetical protein
MSPYATVRSRKASLGREGRGVGSASRTLPICLKTILTKIDGPQDGKQSVPPNRLMPAHLFFVVGKDAGCNMAFPFTVNGAASLGAKQMVGSMLGRLDDSAKLPYLAAPQRELFDPAARDGHA